MLPVFQIFGSSIYTYPLILGIIWSLAYNFLKSYYGKNLPPKFNWFFFSVFVIGWLGAKLLFLLTLNNTYAHKIQTSMGFWLGGGFVFYGGFIGGFIAFTLYLKFTKASLGQFKVLVPVLAIGHGAGRIACFLAGCCYGKFCDLPWSVHLHGANRHPVQLYESFSLILLGVIFFKRLGKGKPVVWEYIASYSILRFMLEFLRGDKIRGVFALGLSTSQFVSLFLLCVASVFLYKSLKSPSKF